MDHALPHKREENRRKGIIVSIMIHTLLLLIALVPYLTSEDTPKDISGIVVAFGTPNAGASNANPLSRDNDTDAADTPKEDDSQQEDQQSTATTKAKITEDPTPAEKPASDLKPISATSDVAAENAKKAKAKKDAEAERRKRQVDLIAKQEAEKAAAEKAKKAAFDDSKSKFSDLLGSSKGKDNADGNVGDPKGDPNSDALNELATGSGRIGGGLTDRGVLYEPDINDNSQYTGVVVTKVCVDKTGKVVEAKFTQLGSTTTNKVLVDLAVKAAKKYKFTPSEVETQCGNITIEFKVK